MSSKYNQHPLERKAREDIMASRVDRDKRDEAYKRWLEWYYQSSDEPPTPEVLFNAGWTERGAEGAFNLQSLSKTFPKFAPSAAGEIYARN